MTQGLICRVIVAIAPASKREWVIAILAEARNVRKGEQLRWHMGAARVALALRIRHRALTIEAAALAFVMLAVDWTSGALLPALALIGLAAFALTRAPSRQSMAALLVASGTLPIAHVIANWVPPLRPSYQYAPLDLRDSATLAAIGAIGLCAVRISSAIRALSNLPPHDR